MKKLDIQSMILQCGENETVVLPKGEYESGPIELKSRMTLEIPKGCIIHFSTKFEDYLPVKFTRWEGVECYNYAPFLYARDCEDITICGEGVLDGQGQAWWHWKKLQREAAQELIDAQSKQIPVEKRVYGTEKAALRPSFLQLIGCKNVKLLDFTIQNGPQWTIHPVYCRDVYAKGLKIWTDGPNTDGLNPDSCQNVLIENCEFSTGDDCIAINSGLNEDGWRVGAPCQNVEIRNCIFHRGHAAVAIGSGMSGGVEKVYVHDCAVENTERGIRIKSMRGRGGYVKNIVFENIKIEETAREPIQISMNYGSSTAVPASDKPPVFSDIRLSGICCKKAGAGIDLCSLPESPMKNLILEKIEIAECY